MWDSHHAGQAILYRAFLARGPWGQDEFVIAVAMSCSVYSHARPSALDYSGYPKARAVESVNTFDILLLLQHSSDSYRLALSCLARDPAWNSQRKTTPDPHAWLA